MEIAKFFTEEERSRIEAVQRQLFAMAADVVQEGDEAKIRKYWERSNIFQICHTD